MYAKWQENYAVDRKLISVNWLFLGRMIIFLDCATKQQLNFSARPEEVDRTALDSIIEIHAKWLLIRYQEIKPEMWKFAGAPLIYNDWWLKFTSIYLILSYNMKPNNEIFSKNVIVYKWQNNWMIKVEFMVDWIKVTWNWYPTTSCNLNYNLIFNAFHARVP